ncbi:endonuclease [Sphingobacterium sp. ML3W]|uniref:endonuclease/exonuclease/phosphatase family protein n=1 Tax=Sphingobacterium sp. ML3W TaxID=1538644 RepID=UPI0004F58D5D|nr:endonuclease/exonuclease/phosphatase family protein [Sphingobacterium sp. ML3W]AIM36355.1 endonuclease [Sphingobacterium sp. ML3W]
MDTAIYIFSSLLIVISFIPLIRNDYWTFRVFEYPRLQKLVLTSLALFLLVVYCSRTTAFYIYISLLSGTILYLLRQILPFTALGKKQVLRTKKDIPDQKISIMISNVFEDNDNYSGCIEEIKKANPDLLLLLETSHEWMHKIKEATNAFPYRVEQPIDNTYGMLLYSKYELKDSEIKFLVEHDIPSIHTKVILPSGQVIQVYAVHPTPPVPGENPRSTERDKELLIIADKASKSKIPVIVCGDLNDVAWSYTTDLFLKTSQLLDPRRGRFFLNTFHAHHFFMRFPLDHIFCSTDFKLKKMKRLHHYNSDHFPILIQLQYEKSANLEQIDHTLELNQEDIDLAKEKKERC